MAAVSNRHALIDQITNLGVADGIRRHLQMRVAIVHYHMEPGGVTSVIAAASEALDVPHVVLSGGHLSYRQGPLSERFGGGELQTVLTDLHANAAAALGGPPDIWHFHNPTLGKHVLFPSLISAMAEAGEKLVLHIHDLAEDGRPQNYQHAPPLYPIGPRIHYAFINKPDRQHFMDAGLPENAATLVHNPVPSRSGIAAPSQPSKLPPLLFAPIRGIRRKNVGELMLLASLLPKDAQIAISRAPQSSEWLGIHNDWKNFAADLDFPISFDVVSEQHPFEQWMERATHFVSTSIAEGFGLPFLESLTYRRPLVGRDLSLNGPTTLYQKILVPLSWLDLDALRSHLSRSLSHTWKTYGKPLPSDAVDRAFQHLLHGDFLDFGNLPESFQKKVILHPDRETLQVLIGTQTQPLKQWLAETLSQPIDLPELPEKFTPQAHAEQLKQIYQHLHRQPAEPPSYLDGEKILSAYLTPENFHFLRSSQPPIKAIIFDLYGTLLLAPPGAVKHDPKVDAEILGILAKYGYAIPVLGQGPLSKRSGGGEPGINQIPPPPRLNTSFQETSLPSRSSHELRYEELESPTGLLHAAVLRHHSASTADFPEIDLRTLWREILHLPPHENVDALIVEIESLWHPARLMPSAAEMLTRLSHTGIPLGILSNAQHHSLSALGEHAALFTPELTFLSYQHGIAKPSPELFQKVRDALTARGISPQHVLFIGNDPLQDIQPAAAVGFQTALYAGHPDSFRPGECQPDLTLSDWHEWII